MTIGKIPVTVVSGFLGSGKTTLLNRLLASPTDDVSGKEGPAHIIVIVNELGAIGLEHTMVRHVKDSVVLLESGCLCCTVRGQLVDTLRDLFLAALHRKIPVFSRIIIETTGIADPAAISYTLKYERFLSDRYRYDGCVSVVDAVFGLWQLENEPVSVKQAVLADVLVISKTDLAAPEQLAGLRQSLHFLNPHALQLLATDAPELQHVLRESSLCANVARIGFGSRPRTDSGTASRTGSWLEGGPPPATAHGNVRTLTMSWGHPIERSAFLKAMSALHEDDDIDVLRLKGVVWLRGDDKASAFHGVHGQLYPLTTLQDSSAKGTSVLVLIFRRPDTMELERRLARLLPGGCRVTM